MPYLPIRVLAIVLSVISVTACRTPTTAPATTVPDAPANPNDEVVFEAQPHAFWTEPDIAAMPTSFVVDDGKDSPRGRVPPDTRMVIGTYVVISCGRDLPIVKREGDSVTMQAFTGGFEFHPTVSVADLGAQIVLGPTLLHDDDGQAFIRLSTGVVVEIVEKLDDTFSRVRLRTRPDLEAVLRHDRLGRIYQPPGDDDVEVGEETWLDPDVPFDVMSPDGPVRAAGVQQRLVWVIGRGDGMTEVVAPLEVQRNPGDAGSAEVHGFVAELPVADSPPVGISGWGGGGRLPEHPISVALDAWMHTEPSEGTRFARADHEHVSAELVERGDEWSRIEARTVWGPIEGFVRTGDLRPPRKAGSYLSRDMVGSCEEPAERIGGR